MRWRKLGCIFAPSGERPWMRSHASVPLAEHVSGDVFRIHFSTRDEGNRSQAAWILLDLSRPSEVLQVADEPLLGPGELGGFDDSGVMPTWLVSRDGVRHLYYIGWNLGITVPFRNAIGLARSEDGERYRRVARGPIMDRTADEPHFCASCAVVADGSTWRMWYLSCTGWSIAAGAPRHHYHIKYAESDDGVQWRREGRVAIDFADASEYAISRPTVLRDADRWRMWYSHRGDRYRIGYAESLDGVYWTRRDDLAGIDVSDTGWDSQMIEYPFVFDHRGARYMLYNGDGYGRTGLGLAVLE